MRIFPPRNASQNCPSSRIRIFGVSLWVVDEIQSEIKFQKVQFFYVDMVKVK